MQVKRTKLFYLMLFDRAEHFKVKIYASQDQRLVLVVEKPYLDP